MTTTDADVGIHRHGSGRPATLLGGLSVAVCDMHAAADGFIEHALRARGKALRPFYSTSANGQVIAQCLQNAAWQDMISEADQIHADGMPMVLFSKLLSANPVPERVATTDLVHAVADRAQRAGVSFYFLGGTEEINGKAVAAMQATYPSLVFAGRRNGYFSPEEEADVVADIRAAKPDILWVGLGFPNEQAFVSRNIDNLRGVGVVKTSGGLFDFLSGKNRRAPTWMQRVGLEWAFRTWLEPRRLGRRYLVTSPVSLYALLVRSDLTGRH